jgi:hypothetical protein
MLQIEVNRYCDRGSPGSAANMAYLHFDLRSCILLCDMLDHIRVLEMKKRISLIFLSAFLILGHGSLV